MGRRNVALGVLAMGVLAGGVVAPRPAQAHFKLTAPDSWMSQDVLGSPQKAGPCGDEKGGTATGKITAYKPGDTVTIQLTETVFHPGHYRVALSVKDRSELPADPKVTAGNTPCGSAAIQSPPVFPVLADGVLPHTSQLNGPQTIKVTLPNNVTCTKCTLQIIEFMSNHALNNPGGCFYHHCADISIQGASSGAGGGGATSTTAATTTTSGAGGAGTTAATTGSSGGADAASGADAAATTGGSAASPEPEAKSGCAVGIGTTASLPAWAIVAALAWIARRRAR
jgi:hypothetical protein